MIRLSVNDTVVVDPGQDVLLNCEIIAGFPTPAVTWSRYPGPLPLSAQVRGPVLFLRAVTPADAGFYNCTAVNNVGNPARKNVNLVVRSKCTFGVVSAHVTQNRVKYPSAWSSPLVKAQPLRYSSPLWLFLAPLIILAATN